MPQGSVLAPILFLLHIDDIAYDINVTLRMFADDWINYKLINNKYDHFSFNQALYKIAYWSQEWQTSVNAQKPLQWQWVGKKEPLIFAMKFSEHN